MAIDIQPTDGPSGAIVTGFDRDELTPADRERIYDAFLEYGVLVFTGLDDLDARTQMAIGAIFGEPSPPHEIPELRHPDQPFIRLLAANGGKPVAEDDPEADKIIGQIPWHSDRAYYESPNRAAALRAIVIPEEGGYTGWIDTARVYRSLPADIKRRIQGLRIVHSYASSYNKQSMVADRGEMLPESSHPLVFVHPENDLPVMALSPATTKEIIGLPKEEADELFELLCRHATADENAYVHQWRPGDVVVWDNWRMLHRAYGHAKRYPRVMNSLPIRGTMRLGRIVKEGSEAAQAA
jgi:taurine dioxygenase